MKLNEFQRNIIQLNNNTSGEVEVLIHTDGKLRKVKGAIYYPARKMNNLLGEYLAPGYIEIIYDGDSHVG